MESKQCSTAWRPSSCQTVRESASQRRRLREVPLGEPLVNRPTAVAGREAATAGQTSRLGTTPNATKESRKQRGRPVNLYHVTDAAAAEAIVRDGFRDGKASLGVAPTWPLGVLVNDEPLSVYDGASGDEVVEVLVPDSTPLDFERLDDAEGYHEWRLSAHVLNEWPRRRLNTTDVEALEADRVNRPGASADLLEALVRIKGDPFAETEGRIPRDHEELS